ncbi:hypothetical protein Agabi119p4_7920 [Agaricus bisporus var. burnettii]|uniref:Integrase catalytic domain-containing protein n=1 Tax=Agaricus bisporus var. burnettii TaxID=192524 RepID=A0A8H7C8G8_AGABI|nr:hypothetical protein Agabi119p4_7920 [Agaricus bisporus var. burnettii]
MLIIDGATSYRKLHFLTSKSADSTLTAFKEFHREAERQTGETLKEVRLDMGREWYNELWSTYIKEHGIVLNFATPYAHQQNGKAERSMRTLLDMARTLLADSGLPQKYWADAVQTAAYVRNLTPTSGDPTNIPAQRWTSQRQDISHLRPFGSTAYAHIPVEVHSSKLSPRSVKLTLIGYYGHTAYKLMDRTTGAVYKSREVIFEEARPHLSTDIITTFSGDDSRSSNRQEIAPRPLPINTLHGADNSTTMITPLAVPAPTQGGTASATGDKALDVTEGVKEPPLVLRRSQRESKPSQRMKESLEYLQRPEAHATESITEDSRVPKNHHEAMRRPDLWLEPMMKELNVMTEKQVFRLVPRPTGRNIVKSRWVFANKYDEAGTVVSRKARLVAKGFTQVIGEDYDETYASVARLESVRMVCAIAASRGLRLWQVDFVSAFLNSENSFEVYMEQPPGFEEGGDHVWLLLKTLYGTMQGAHDWAQTLDRTYAGHGYYISKADPQVRSKVEGDEFTLTSTWTDDVLGASSTTDGEAKAKDELGRSYEIKDLGEAKFILGMRIERGRNGNVRLSQRAYCERIIERFKQLDLKPRSTPLPVGVTLSIEGSPDSDEEKADMKNVPYREVLGSLMWLQVATRPDLSYAVNILSRFANNPGRSHWDAMKHTLGYIKGTMDYGITYYRDATIKPFGYVDSDFAGDINSRRSTEGHVFFVAGGPISWASRRQDTASGKMHFS